MKIAVFIKQVPAVDTVKIDEDTGTMVREGVEAELNPLDLHALEAAIRLREANSGTRVTAVTMGPLPARKILAGAIAMGCDDAALLSDRKFAGADTLATARVLAAYVKYAGGFDLIFTGERATDGETGQVPPALAEFLGCPALTYVSGIDQIDSGKAVVERSVEGARETLLTPLPAVFSVIKEINKPRLTTLSGKMRAKTVEIPVCGAADLGLEDDVIGLKGSPTRVTKVLYPKVIRSGSKYFMAENVDKAMEALRSYLSEGGFLDFANERAAAR